MGDYFLFTDVDAALATVATIAATAAIVSSVLAILSGRIAGIARLLSIFSWTLYYKESMIPCSSINLFRKSGNLFL